MIGVMLMQNGNVINKTWIILDTCSKYSEKNNLYYVEDVHDFAKDKDITVLTNGG